VAEDSAAELQHPRRNLANRFRSQAEKFVKLSRKDEDRCVENLAWAEQNAQQALLHDFTDERNWLTLVHVKMLRKDSDGIHRCLEDLFTVLGRDSDRLSSLEGMDFLTHGHGMMSASLTEDPLEVEEWWNHVSQNDAVLEFAERCRRLDFRDQRANIIFGRRMQKLRENKLVDLFMELVQHLLAHRPSNHELWLELGRLHEQRKEYDEAWLCYDHVQALRPNSPERDRLLSRLTSRMDSTSGWSPPVDDIRSKFLRKMEELASEVSEAKVEDIDASSGEVEVVDQELLRLQSLLDAGDGEEAFFLARRLLAGGEEWARPYLEQATALLD
jgi:tetratricopeptide (TPR) repeat protein